MSEERERVLGKLDEDPLAADIQLSLFISAAQNYRHDTVLRPFPPAFINSEGEKDFRNLQYLCRKMPTINDMKRELRSSMNRETLELLDWVFNSRTFSLKSHGKSKFEEIKALTGAPSYELEPTHIFEVVPSENSEAKFQEVRDSRDLLYAYHGSRLENFHSILHNGLHAHMNKNSLFGEGTYLSSDLCVTMPYAPAGGGWDRSQVGGTLSCVAVCEMVDHPSVKCTVKDKESNVNRSRAQAPSSLGGDVPEKYYVVTNNQVIRVKYLLVFASKTPPRVRSQSSRIITWFRQHMMITIMTIYALLLMFIGFMNSSAYKVFLNKYLGFR
ncbi:protein mono-ADP-ribosyltransferase PARP16-like [Ptychodera flava]|uniref:protein mono-ADP-ribosyltransferase PARP16-like n=1 Tax=Ptychodera flava TaxID=63121 RepID=UPI00396A0456